MSNRTFFCNQGYVTRFNVLAFVFMHSVGFFTLQNCNVTCFSLPDCFKVNSSLLILLSYVNNGQKIPVTRDSGRKFCETVGNNLGVLQFPIFLLFSLFFIFKLLKIKKTLILIVSSLGTCSYEMIFNILATQTSWTIFSKLLILICA